MDIRGTRCASDCSIFGHITTSCREPRHRDRAVSEGIHSFIAGDEHWLIIIPQTIVHQLLHPLLALSSETGPLSDDKKQENLAMQQSSLHALITVMRVCRPCIHRWKGSITEGIARCWTASIDNEACQPTGKTSKCSLSRMTSMAVCAEAHAALL